MSEMLLKAAHAIREETVRQHRDNDRGKCPAGVAYYEECVSPQLTAAAVFRAMRYAAPAMLAAGLKALDPPLTEEELRAVWRAMIDAAPV